MIDKIYKYKIKRMLIAMGVTNHSSSHLYDLKLYNFKFQKKEKFNIIYIYNNSFIPNYMYCIFFKDTFEYHSIEKQFIEDNNKILKTFGYKCLKDCINKLRK